MLRELEFRPEWGAFTTCEDMESPRIPSPEEGSDSFCHLDELVAEPLAEALHPQVAPPLDAESNVVHRVTGVQTESRLDVFGNRSSGNNNMQQMHLPNAALPTDLMDSETSDQELDCLGSTQEQQISPVEEREILPATGTPCLDETDVSGRVVQSVHSLEALKRTGAEEADDFAAEQSSQQESRWLGCLSFLRQESAADDGHQSICLSAKPYLPASPKFGPGHLHSARLTQKSLASSMTPPPKSSCTDRVGSALSPASTIGHRSRRCLEAFSVDYKQPAADSRYTEALFPAVASQRLAPIKPARAQAVARPIDTLLPRSVSSPVLNRNRRAEQSDDVSPAFSTKSSTTDYSVGSGSGIVSIRKHGGRSKGSQNCLWPPVCRHVPAMSLLPASVARTHKQRRPNSVEPMPPFEETQSRSRASSSHMSLRKSTSDASLPLRLPPLPKSGKLSQEALFMSTFGTRLRAQGYSR